jgi:hypothetical protein
MSFSEQIANMLATAEEQNVLELVSDYVQEKAQLFDDPLYLLVIPYMLGQPLFRKYCQSSGTYEKHKKTWKAVMAGYNVILSLFSFWTFAHMVYELYYNVAPACGGTVFSLDHFKKSDAIGGWYRTLSYLFYVSKYLEFLDSYFLILIGRPVSWLQYLHHIGGPLDMGMLYHNEAEGIWIYVVLNGFIHTIMYYYYACAIMKWPFYFPKQLITTMQLLQFVAGLACGTAYVFVDGIFQDEIKMFVIWFNNAFVVMNTVLFLNFYHKNYLRKKTAAEQPKQEVNTVSQGKTETEEKETDSGESVSSESDSTSLSSTGGTGSPEPALELCVSRTYFEEPALKPEVMGVSSSFALLKSSTTTKKRRFGSCFRA